MNSLAKTLNFTLAKISTYTECKTKFSQNDTPRSPMFCMGKSLFCSGKPQNHSNKNLK